MSNKTRIFQRRKIGTVYWEDVPFDKYEDMICMPSIWELRIVYAAPKGDGND